MLHKTFASRFQLNELVASALTDADRIEYLVEWVHSLWQPQPGRTAKSDNPISIVSRAKNGERFLRADYTIVLANAMQAIGIPTRITTLHTRDFVWRPLSSRYSGIEYFDQEHFKWVWLDSQFGVRVLKSQKPLNVLEMKDALLNKNILELKPDYKHMNIEDYFLKIEPYLDVIVACPIGQTKKYALIPPQLTGFKKKWLVGNKLYDITCHSIASFYASHPIKQLTKPGKTQAIDIRTGKPLTI
jgi:hypothetical protein